MIGRAPLLSPPIARILVRLSIVLYCIVIFLVLDFCYSAFLRDEGHSARYPHPVYHHALLPNFDGYDNWGDHRYKFYTDSLGFRDAVLPFVFDHGSLLKSMATIPFVLPVSLSV